MKILKVTIICLGITIIFSSTALANDYINYFCSNISLSKGIYYFDNNKINQYPGKGLILDVPLIAQNPELPRGCEVTSLAMLLNYAGIKVDKMKLAKEVKKDLTPYYKVIGQVYFGNPHTGFVGNMYNIKKPGLGVYNEPVSDLAEVYLPGNIINLTGSNFNTVLSYVNNIRPVWVIINTMYSTVPDDYWETWITPIGKIKITYKEHSVLITGYDDTYVYFNDPLREVKDRKVKKIEFEKAYNQMGKQAITYKISQGNNK